MDCDDALFRVYEYLDGEMTVWRRRAITRHLDECPPCADGFVFEVELRRIVVSKCREEVPTVAAQRIAEALGIVSTESELLTLRGDASRSRFTCSDLPTFYDGRARERRSRRNAVRTVRVIMLLAAAVCVFAMAGVALGIGVLRRPQRREVLVLLDRAAAHARARRAS